LTPWVPAGGETSVVVEEDVPFSGTHSMTETGSASRPILLVTNSLAIPAKPNELFYSEMYTKSEGADGQVRLVLVWLNPNGTLVTYDQALASPTTDYAKLSLSAIAPVGTSQALSQIGTLDCTTGKWRFDDVLVVKKKFRIENAIYTLNPPILTVPSVVLS
jgi:hypothetical protein